MLTLAKRLTIALGFYTAALSEKNIQMVKGQSHFVVLLIYKGWRATAFTYASMGRR